MSTMIITRGTGWELSDMCGEKSPSGECLCVIIVPFVEVMTRKKKDQKQRLRGVERERLNNLRIMFRAFFEFF